MPDITKGLWDPGNIFQTRHYEGLLKIAGSISAAQTFVNSYMIIGGIVYIRFEGLSRPFTIPAFLGGDYEVVPIPPSITSYITPNLFTWFSGYFSNLSIYLSTFL